MTSKDAGDIGSSALLLRMLTMMCSQASKDFSYFGGAESLAEGKTVWQNGSPRRTVVVSPDEKTEGLYGAPQDPNDFLWIMTEEPHRTRRKEIMKAHPEVHIYLLACTKY